MRKLLLLALLCAGCASTAPPKSLSPVGAAAFQKTRAIKVLDLLRDTAIDANAQQPPLISTATTRKVVQAHQLSLQAIQASDSGWAAAVGVTLAKLSHDPSLLPEEVQRLSPYFELAAQVLKGLQ